MKLKFKTKGVAMYKRSKRANEVTTWITHAYYDVWYVLKTPLTQNLVYKV